MSRAKAGYREIEHTADWELQAWAPDLAGLLEQAALGMYALSGTLLAETPRFPVHLNLPAYEAEQLLVSFLSELLWIGEKDGLGFDSFEMLIENDHLQANLVGKPIIQSSKEIKAVTYHNLVILETAPGLNVNIVFDV